MSEAKYRTPDAARYCAIAESTLAKARLRGDGPRYAKFGRCVIYDKADLDDWLASLKRKSTSQLRSE